MFEVTEEMLCQAAQKIDINANTDGMDHKLYYLLCEVRKGTIKPRLALALMMGRDHIFTHYCNCTSSQRVELENDPIIKVVVLRKNGEWKINKRAFTTLTRIESSQVFFAGGIRSEEAQKVWLLSKQNKIQEAALPGMGVKILKSKKIVRIYEPRDITLSELREWAKQLS